MLNYLERGGKNVTILEQDFSMNVDHVSYVTSHGQLFAVHIKTWDSWPGGDVVASSKWTNRLLGEKCVSVSTLGARSSTNLRATNGIC